MEYRLSLAGRSPLWFRIRFEWSKYPLLYQPYCRWRYPNSTLFKDTDLLIEGFGRSSNGYTGDCFRITNDFKLKMAWGQKAAAAVIEAARWNVPTLMLAREPRAVVLSYKTMNPNLPIDLLLRHYASYYDYVWPLREHFVAATNVQVWEAFGDVAARLNARFGTRFNEEVDSVALRDQVIEFQNSEYRKVYGDNWSESVKRTLNYPTEEKKRMREAIEGEYDDPRHRALSDQAYERFHRYEELAKG